VLLAGAASKFLHALPDAWKDKPVKTWSEGLAAERRETAFRQAAFVRTMVTMRGMHRREIYAKPRMHQGESIWAAKTLYEEACEIARQDQEPGRRRDPRTL